VCRCRSMADLAGNGLMACLAVSLDNLRMAWRASLTSRVMDRLLHNGFKPRRPAVSLLPKGVRDQEVSSYDQCA
jgi:hypothetical protein